MQLPIRLSAYPRDTRLSSSAFADYDTAARAIRTRLGVARLPKDLIAQVKDAVARHAARQGRRVANDRLSDVMGRLRARQLREVNAAVAPLMAGLFRAAATAWAGGTTRDRVTISAEARAAGVTGRVWSKNGKWSGTDLDRCVNVMPGWRAKVLGRGLAVLDGLLTTHAAPAVRYLDGIEVYRASWVRQGRGYDLVAESGLIAFHRGSGTAYHLRGDDTVKAVSGLKRKMKAQAIPSEEREAKRRAGAATRAAHQAAKLARLVERVTRGDLAGIEHVVVTRADSLRAGNCATGTDGFIARFLPGRDEATIGAIAHALGRLDIASLTDAERTLARQVAAACLVAIRRDRNARRLVTA
jgi:hypothetical protein